MNFRNAQKSDINGIMEVEKASFIKEIQEQQSVFEKRIEVCPEGFFVFENEDKAITGYLCGEFLEKMPESQEELKLGHLPSPASKNHQFFYISSFAILPQFRGKGTGSLLFTQILEHVKAQFPQIKFLLLVNEQWKNAIQVYKKSGFSEIKVFNHFFPVEKDLNSDLKENTAGILMEKA